MQLEIRNIVIKGTIQFAAEVAEWLMETPEAYESFRRHIMSEYHRETDDPIRRIELDQTHLDSIDAMGKNSRFLLGIIPDDPPVPIMAIHGGTGQITVTREDDPDAPDS